MQRHASGAYYLEQTTHLTAYAGGQPAASYISCSSTNKAATLPDNLTCLFSESYANTTQ